MRSVGQLILKFPTIVRELGVRWIVFRLFYSLRTRFGFLRRACPQKPWAEFPALALKVSMHKGSPTEVWWTTGIAVERAERLLAGKWVLFGITEIQTDLPPRWHENPLTGQIAPQGAHWSSLGDFDYGDIKGIWELSRFSWAFDLARAYSRTTDERYCAAYLQLLVDWVQHNPPNTGVNWRCGQESSFRLFAAVFAWEQFQSSPRIAADHRAHLARLVVATGYRIAANLDYALSQKNNHGLSECVGLITAALLVPDIPESRKWYRRGLDCLESQVKELVYPDGAFSQHSLYYHRVALHVLAWGKVRMELGGKTVPPWLNEAGSRLVHFLAELTHPGTGYASHYGSNDGSNILPLADCTYEDLRPALQMGAVVFLGRCILPPGPWDEASFWLERKATIPSSDLGLPKRRWLAPQGGCAIFRSGDLRAFFRCPTHFRHRPAQADLLHVDLDWKGRAITLDPGSYSYNSPARFSKVFKSAHGHNAVTIGTAEPLERLSRFLYINWPHGKLEEKGELGLIASHDGYAKQGVNLRREVNARSTDEIEIFDRIECRELEPLCWHWLLAGSGWSIGKEANTIERCEEGLKFILAWRCTQPGAKISVVERSEDSAYGWWSPSYSGIRSATSLLIEVKSKLVELKMIFTVKELQQ